MRLLTWTLGFMVVLLGLELSRQVADGWAWLWWVWLGLWLVIGLVVMVTRVVQFAVGKKGAAPVFTQPPGAPGKGSTHEEG